MIDLRNHYGFTRTPFGKDLTPSMLHHYPAHAEAVARITWCARERALGVITGEVGSGKTVSARTAIAGLDQTRHTLICWTPWTWRCGTATTAGTGSARA